MGAWAGLVYNNGLIRCESTDWLEIDKLNLGDPEILEVNNGQVVTPTKSFIQLEEGTTPSTSQCHTIGFSGIPSGTILVIRGLSTGSISMLSTVGNINIVPAVFDVTSYSTMVLIRYSVWSEIARSDNN
jgi:hypothetical protein